VSTVSQSLSASRGRAARHGFGLGAGLFLLTLLISAVSDEPRALRMAAVVALMASLWISEAVPLAATALLPLVLFPLLGVLPGRETAPFYVNSTIFLFLGGFMIGRCMEAWGLHRRLALWIIGWVGSGPRRVALGLMLASALLSMFISNTATAVIMLPIAVAVIVQVEERAGARESRAFAAALMLGVAYACSVGGIATLVGTPPNLALQRILQVTFPEAPVISFGQWLLFGLPLSVTFLLLIWLLLTRVFFHLPKELALGEDVIRQQYVGLGPMQHGERMVLLVFIATALLWTSRLDLNLGFVTLPGWSRLLPHPEFVDDGSVAIAMAMLLFLIPSRNGSSHGPAVMPPDIFRRLPWDIVLLFGGGFALAAGFQASGLSALVGQQFDGLVGVPAIVAILATCAILSFLTEFTSNTATTQLLLPILASVAVTMRVDPRLLMIPAAISASCAFMMPVATPPNAIVFGSGRLRIAQMARVGVWINLIGVLLVAFLFSTLGRWVLRIDSLTLPDWAH
jgi:sodium-dependent dicarboxylate transporter 2/3/5